MEKKREELKDLIKRLEEESRTKDTPLWKGVAKGLKRPNRKSYSVNVGRIEKYANAKDTVIVPGKVLSGGEITKAVNVAAINFSKQAMEKIEKAGGKCLSIEDVIDKKPKNARIMG